MKRLAENIDALAEKDEGYVRRQRDIEQLRRQAAQELYSICRDFVSSINRLTSRGGITLDPEEFPKDGFQEDGTNLVQIGVRGRILQVTYSATHELVSTEDFRVPYTLEGFVRSFNQELLDRRSIEEQMVFYTLEKNRHMWRFFDPRTYRSGTFDQEYLVSLMEQLL